MKVMNLLGVQNNRQFSLLNRYSNFTDAELKTLSQGVVDANKNLADAQKSLADVQKRYDQDKAVYDSANAAPPNMRLCSGAMIKSSAVGYGESKYGATNFFLYSSKGPPELDINKEGLQGNCFMIPGGKIYSFTLLTSRVKTIYPSLINDAKSKVNNAQTAYNDADKKYKAGLATLSPEQQVELQAATQAIIDSQSTSTLKNRIMIGGAIIGGLAIATFLFIYFQKKVKTEL